MSNTNDNTTPVRVTGEERRHPAIRKLARACIELARLRLAEKTAKPAGASEAQGPGGKEERRNG